MRQEMLGFWDAMASAGHMQTVSTSVKTDNHTNTSALSFFDRLDALSPDVSSVKVAHAPGIIKLIAHARFKHFLLCAKNSAPIINYFIDLKT